MRSEELANLFFESILKKTSNVHFIDGPILPRKRRRPSYKTMKEYFVVEGNLKEGKAYNPMSPKEHFRGIYHEDLGDMVNSIKHRFEQPRYKIFSCLESFLLEIIILLMVLRIQTQPFQTCVKSILMKLV